MKPTLNADIAKVKVEPWLEIRGKGRNITIQETYPVKFIRIALQSRKDTQYVELKTLEDFDKLWNKLLELSVPCY